MMLPMDIRIIDEIGINERTIVSWYDRLSKSFSFGIFHISDQPNVISKITPYSIWGYTVYVAPPIEDHIEASEVYNLFLKDLMDGNNWFEDDTKFEIPKDLEYLMEDTKKSLDEIDNGSKVRPKLVLIKNEELC